MSHVVFAIASVGEGVTCPNHRGVYVEQISICVDRGTGTNDAAIAVGRALITRDDPAFEQVIEKERSGFATAVTLAFSILTHLPAFGGIEAMKPDAFALDFYGIPINHRRATFDRASRRLSAEQGASQRQHGITSM